MPEVICFGCQTKVPFEGVLGRRSECPKCRADLHVCKNCQHHDPKAYNECLEPSADVVKEKDRANFCDHFTPGNKAGGSGPSKDDLKKAAEALFRKKS